ncbi:hypothetical protein, partial [Burkholderia pseudomallei]|uniref:hypothetical protein n=1 Tax=Burkholderia pseudomallei TaxID=28450 RepID=UPI001E29640E
NRKKIKRIKMALALEKHSQSYDNHPPPHTKKSTTQSSRKKKKTRQLLQTSPSFHDTRNAY